MIKADLVAKDRICQGDILREISNFENYVEVGGTCEIKLILFPHIIVLTQDCDLEQDFDSRRLAKENQDKYLISVLVAPLYNAEHFFVGEHLSELKRKSWNIQSSTEKRLLVQNQLPRYHYMEFPLKTAMVNSVIDFKHYFTVEVEYLKNLKSTNFVCTVCELYREAVAHRFAYFLSRIGLPDLAPQENQS